MDVGRADRRLRTQFHLSSPDFLHQIWHKQPRKEREREKYGKADLDSKHALPPTFISSNACAVQLPFDRLAAPLNLPRMEVPMRLIRVLFGLFLLAGVCFLLLGYWAGSSFGRIERPSDTIGTAGDIDTQKARERGAELGEKAAVAKMALDDVVKARTIDVDTDGATVTLTGRVHSAAERDRAVALARETEGVTRVVDRLRVEP
jgi:hypothetical protein